MLSRRQLILGTLGLASLSYATLRKPLATHPYKRYAQQLGNLTINYTVAGNPDHPPLLWLHGYAREPELYPLHAMAKNFHVIAPEIYGIITPTEQATLTMYAKLTAEFCNARALPSCNIAGHSTGATVAEFPHLDPYRKSLISTSPISATTYGTSGFIVRGLYMNANELSGRAGGWQAHNLGLRDIIATLKNRFAGFDEKKAFSTNVARYERTPIQIREPTLMLQGESDELFTANEAELQKKFTNLEWKVIRAPTPLYTANHEWPIFFPELLCQEMDAFYTTHTLY